VFGGVLLLGQAQAVAPTGRGGPDRVELDSDQQSGGKLSRTQPHRDAPEWGFEPPAKGQAAQGHSRKQQ